MASNGYFNTSAYEGRYLQFAWKEVSQNVANNTTTISWTLKGLGGGNVWYKSGNFKLVIAGDTVFSSENRIQLDNGTTVASGNYTFKHNADGSKTFSASAEAGIYSVAVNCQGSGNFTLDAIPRASQPSCITYPNHTQNVGEFGDEISIHMNRNSSAFTHTVRYQFGSKSGTIATGVTTGTTWVIPLTLMDLIPATTSGSGTIFVDTYNGSTKIGTKSCGFTATVPASVKPSCTFTLTDVTGVDKIYGSPVKGLSQIKVVVTPKLAYSSPIASYVVTANGVRYTSASPTTGLLSTYGKSTVTATVTDKRGRSGSVTYDMNVLNYAVPVVSAASAKRCDADGKENKRGAYVKVVFSAAVTSLSSKNNALYYIKYKRASDTSYTSVSLTELTNAYSVSGYAYIFAANKGSSYDILVEAVDRHNSGHPATKGTKAPTAFAIMSWRGFKTSNGVEDGLGIGKVPDKPNAMQVGWDAEFDKALVRKGNSFAFQPGAFNGDKGYTLLAVITLNSLNVNAPIAFKINRRGATCPMTVYARFASSSTSTDPDLASITYEGDNYGAYMIKESTSRWKLYVDNTGGWSNPCLQEWYTTDNQMTRISVEFLNEQVASLTTPWYRATPIVSRSILDAFYPVGYILLLYSHADPNDMYPGTNWVRIQGAFPWFTDGNGEIGLTGGERNVTLTVNQIPAHSHGSVYSQHATGTKDKAWYSATGSSVAYGAVETGGGQAHNNMPPYIQISAWRRTA